MDLRTNEEAWAMALENEGLANKICRRFLDKGVPRGIDFEWLKSVAWEGLHRAAKQWNPKVARFSTFAMLVMRNELLRAMQRHEAAQGGPRSHDSKVRVAWVGSIEADTDFYARMGESPTKQAEPAYMAVEDPGYEEVDERLSSEGVFWMERLEGLLKDLPEHHQDWIRQRLAGRMFTEIAADAGVTGEAVRGIFYKTVGRLRNQVEVAR